jgi:antitoxin ParD1/3/4
MATLSITFSDDETAWVDRRVVELGLTDTGAFVSRLIEADRSDAAHLDRLRNLIREGDESGISDESLQDIYEGYRKARAAA